MFQADELASLLGISDSAPDAYLLIPGNAELEANTTKAAEHVKELEDVATEPVMAEFSAHHLPLFLTALHSHPVSSPASSASLSMLAALTSAGQPLFVRFLREDPRAKDLLIKLVEKLATYPKDLLEVDLKGGSSLISTHLSLLTSLLLTSLSLSPHPSTNLTTLLPQPLRAAAIQSINHHHLILTRAARATKDTAEKDHWRGVMAEIDRMKLVLNWEGDLGESGSGVSERAAERRREGKGVWVRCEAKVGGGDGKREVGECDWTRAEMVPCGRCGAVRYCSTEHRRADIKPHKKRCFKPTW